MEKVHNVKKIYKLLFKEDMKNDVFSTAYLFEPIELTFKELS